MPDSEARLRRQFVKLKELRAKDAKELTQLRADVHGLVRIVNQLLLENHQLREALSRPAASIRPLPQRPHH
ncbi:hypothetical protein SAMN05414137_107321 [Streptacidiphilus jiangxiensis]|uniref:Uncharacterized protein n=2 Tax=Streptacidiphilus jiangxiensis TaxID=235985 RepID=A0A1H7PEB6_STRJI|nr:hypothetical protein SAMN05414137_107321 [Streptacidiphilus jiangxiensis]